MVSNHAAWLDEKAKPLRIGEAPMPIPGPHDVVVENRAIAVNPLDNLQFAVGAMVKSFPYVLGSDVAGQVHEVGSKVKKFKKGDRIVGHCWGLITGASEDGAFAKYTKVPVRNAAPLPSSIPFREAAVIPLALDTAVCGLFQDNDGSLRLSWPTPSSKPASNSQVIVVYGGSSSVGTMATQLTTAAGVRVIAIASTRNHEYCRKCGASAVFDYRDANIVDEVVKAVGKDTFIGVYDCISTADTYAHVLPILEKLGGGSLACTHNVPDNLPSNVKAKYMFGLGAFSFPLWDDFVGSALASGQLKCLPEPLVVGKGLESLQAALDTAKAGVSAQKVVVEL